MSLQQTPALPFNAVRLVIQTLGTPQSQLSALLEGTGVAVQEFMAGEGYFNWGQLQQLIERILDSNPPADLPLKAGLQGGPAIHGAMGIAALTSSNLVDALEMFKTYMALRSQIFTVSHDEHHGDFSLLGFDFLPPPSPVLNFMVQAIMSSAYASIESLLGKPLQGAEVHFRFPALAGSGAYQEAFPGSRVLFGMPGNAILIPRRFVDQPLLSSDRQMHGLALQQCKVMQDDLLRKGTASGLVLGRLRQAKGRAISLEDMAAHMNLSQRTLLRRLKEEGTTFQQLLDLETSSRAASLILQPGVTVAQVAELLGYAEPVTFRRAFRRWFGVSPSEYKQSHH